MKALCILVVEDDAMVALVLAEMLKTMGHSICAIVATEADAVVAALQFRPELMIVDVQLREGSGLGAVDRIQIRQLLAHVFVCGDARRIRHLRPQATVIQKPYFEHDLTLAIRRAVYGSAA